MWATRIRARGSRKCTCGPLTGRLFADAALVVVGHCVGRPDTGVCRTLGQRVAGAIIPHAGCIVERGTRDELVAAGGIYARMVAVQTGAIEGAVSGGK